MSPLGKADDTAITDDTSTPMQLWRHFMLLWPNYPGPHVLDHLNDHEYFPVGLDNITLNSLHVIARLRRLLRDSDTEMKFDLLEYFEGSRPRLHAPSKDLFIKVRQVLQKTFGPDIHLNITERRGLIPDIENSIGIATLSRRLIIGDNCLRSSFVTGNHFLGLGPAGTVEGDEVFLLTGGKTPFVLRRRDDTDDTIPGPKYEIIGDCYLQGWMDGEGEGLALDDWEDITLV